MRLESEYDIGQQVWCIRGKRPPELLTIGMVRVEITDSPGLNDGRVEAGCDIQFDNYKAQSKREESYMMVETGVGSGNVYTPGRDMFSTITQAYDAAREIAESAA